MNWTEFKMKYKNEMKVGVIVFMAYMLIRLIKNLFKN